LRRLCGLIALLMACSPVAGAERNDNPVIHGTINIVLANHNGMVVLTDSMLTSGRKQLPTPGKKLFRLDDHTVGAIAGIIYSPSGSYKELDMNTVAIVDDYARQISTGTPIPILQKLRELAFILNTSLTADENTRSANNEAINADDYVLELTVAGYDTDGLLKIGKVTLRSRNMGGDFDSDIASRQIRTVQGGLLHEFSGMPDRAEFIMAHPQTLPRDAAIATYQASLQSDQGESLDLDRMTELAKRLKYYSTRAHPEIGGPNQVAIIQAGKIIKFSQPPFPNSAPVTRFSLFVGASFSGRPILFRVDAMGVFIRCHWNNIYVPIDRSFFIGNEFQDSLVAYSGGPLHFDQTNKVVDSEVFISGVTQYSRELSDLRARFVAGRTANYDEKKIISLFITTRSPAILIDR